MNTRALLLSGLIAGVLMALLAELPFISLLNCCLCLWIWAGGIFAVYLYRRFDNTVGPTTITHGLLVGLVAGLVAAVLGTIIAAIMGPIAWQYVNQLITTIQGSGVDMGPLADMFRSTSGFSLFELFTNLVLYALFGLVGGILGTLIFKGKQDVPATTA
jgi:Flp pilus assembly pilin Flp